eukprot:6326398-Prymnesium_polylepis.1
MEHSIAQGALIPRHDDQGYYPTEVDLKKYFEDAVRPRDDIVVEGRPLYIEIELMRYSLNSASAQVGGEGSM